MRYVQYYHKGVMTEELIESCSDRAVVILDGRNSITTSIEDGHNFNGYRRPKYEAFKIYQGDNLLRSKPISKLILAR